MVLVLSLLAQVDRWAAAVEVWDKRSRCSVVKVATGHGGDGMCNDTTKARARSSTEGRHQALQSRTYSILHRGLFHVTKNNLGHLGPSPPPYMTIFVNRGPPPPPPPHCGNLSYFTLPLPCKDQHGEQYQITWRTATYHLVATTPQRALIGDGR